MTEQANIPDERLSAYLDGELSEAEAVALERDLAADPALRRQLEELAEVKRLVGSLPHVAAPAGLAHAVRAQLERQSLLGERPLVARDRRWGVFVRVAALAASVAVVAALAVIAWRHVNPPIDRTPAIHVVADAGRDAATPKTSLPTPATADQPTPMERLAEGHAEPGSADETRLLAGMDLEMKDDRGVCGKLAPATSPAARDLEENGATNRHGQLAEDASEQELVGKMGAREAWAVPAAPGGAMAEQPGPRPTLETGAAPSEPAMAAKGRGAGTEAPTDFDRFGAPAEPAPTLPKSLAPVPPDAYGKLAGPARPAEAAAGQKVAGGYERRAGGGKTALADKTEGRELAAAEQPLAAQLRGRALTRNEVLDYRFSQEQVVVNVEADSPAEQRQLNDKLNAFLDNNGVVPVEKLAESAKLEANAQRFYQEGRARFNYQPQPDAADQQQVVLYVERSVANRLINTMQDAARGQAVVEVRNAEAARGLAGRRVAAQDDFKRQLEQAARAKASPAGAQPPVTSGTVNGPTGGERAVGKIGWAASESQGKRSDDRDAAAAPSDVAQQAAQGQANQSSVALGQFRQAQQQVDQVAPQQKAAGPAAPEPSAAPAAQPAQPAGPPAVLSAGVAEEGVGRENRPGAVPPRLAREELTMPAPPPALPSPPEAAAQPPVAARSDMAQQQARPTRAPVATPAEPPAPGRPGDESAAARKDMSTLDDWVSLVVNIYRPDGRAINATTMDELKKESPATQPAPAETSRPAAETIRK